MFPKVAASRAPSLCSTALDLSASSRTLTITGETHNLLLKSRRTVSHCFSVPQALKLCGANAGTFSYHGRRSTFFYNAREDQFQKSTGFSPLVRNPCALPGGLGFVSGVREYSSSFTSRPRAPPNREKKKTIVKVKQNKQSRQSESELEWQILKRWDLPWNWKTFSLISLACELSYFLSGKLVEGLKATTSYEGIQIGGLSSDGKAIMLLLTQSFSAAVVLYVLYTLTNTFGPRPANFFRYDWRKPFDLQKGWLLWSGIGLIGVVIGMTLVAAMIYYSGQIPKRQGDPLLILLPLIGSSSISTACVFGVVGVLAPILEETVFRGFLMASLTKWLPTPVSVLISSAVFAAEHCSPGIFPQLFVVGSVLGFSYAQTRNLLTPITIHALFNSAMILLCTYLKLKGIDIEKILQEIAFLSFKNL